MFAVYFGRIELLIDSYGPDRRWCWSLVTRMNHPRTIQSSGRRARFARGRFFGIGGLGLEGAFTLVEVMISVGIATVALVSIVVGFSSAMQTVRFTEEQTRAVRIMSQRMEMVRIYPWSRITNSAFLSTPFTNYLRETTWEAPSGPRYIGTYTLGPGPSGVNYSNRLRTLTITLTWNSVAGTHTRQLSSLISDSGLVTRTW